MIYFNDDELKNDDILDLDIDEEFDLDLDIDDIDLDDDISPAKSSADNSQAVSTCLIPGEISNSNLEYLSTDFKQKIESYIQDNSVLSDIKNELSSLYNDTLKNFILLEFPPKNNPAKISLLRYNFVDSRILKDEQFEKIKNIKLDKLEFNENTKFPVYYADEWLEYVCKGKITLSAGEDVSSMKKSSKNPELEKSTVSRELQNTDKNIESMLRTRDENIEDFRKYSEIVISTKGNNIRDLATAVQNISSLVVAINNYGQRIKTLQMKSDELNKKLKGIKTDSMNTEEEDPGNLLSEFTSVKDMSKMSTGPRGNHFPFLIGDYFPVFINDREAVANIIKDYSNLLQDLFYRKFLGIESNNCPNVLIAPCYGTGGFCWDPIDPANKETGRGKIVVPLYSQIKTEELVADAIGDYYWNKNKSMAGSRWLEEGITGRYYMYHQDLKIQKKKGKDVKVIPDLKESFLFHFKQWILEERIGRSKLPKEVRTMFWFNIPFDEKTKDELAKMNFTYKTLYENEQRKQ